LSNTLTFSKAKSAGFEISFHDEYFRVAFQYNISYQNYSNFAFNAFAESLWTPWAGLGKNLKKSNKTDLQDDFLKEHSTESRGQKVQLKSTVLTVDKRLNRRAPCLSFPQSLPSLAMCLQHGQSKQEQAVSSSVRFHDHWGSSRLANTICLNQSRLNPSLWFRKFSLFVFCFHWLNILLYFLILTSDERWMKSNVSAEHFWLTCSDLQATTNLTCLAGGAGFPWGIPEVFLLNKDFAKVMMIFSTRNPAPSFFHQSGEWRGRITVTRDSLFVKRLKVPYGQNFNASGEKRINNL